MSDKPWRIMVGDNRVSLRELAENSVDAIVTDPPYELGFMGKGWDKTGIANDVKFWDDCLRVLKPGGHLVAFSGSRTYHRMVCAIEDAGFEVRDQMMWVYGSGFPKSLNVGKKIEGWDGWGTALKPAHEPIVLARKPLEGTVAANVLKWGVGGLNIDACRVGTEGGTSWESRGYKNDEGQFGGGIKDGKVKQLNAGRWPANLMHDGSEGVLELFPNQKSPAPYVQKSKSVGIYGPEAHHDRPSTHHGDSGSAARFFYCPKASKRDRDEGCQGMEEMVSPKMCDTGYESEKRFDGSPCPKRRNSHPTVKPTELMAYLCRLVTPPGGLILDPFMGSGSTGKAAIREGFRFVGMELSQEYADIAASRISHEGGRVKR